MVCLISEWRLAHDYMKLGKKLGLPILFETGHDERPRGELVREAIEDLSPTQYCIIDDQEIDFEYDGMPFINVPEEDGYGYKDYLLTLEYLK